MNVRRTYALAAGLVAAALAAPALAAGGATATVGPKPQITDVAGDANGINDQGTGSPVSLNVAGPVDDSNADITSVVFATHYATKMTTRKVTTVVKGRRVTHVVSAMTLVPDGFTVTMNLSAAPDGRHAYDVYATHGICDGEVDFTYSTGTLGLNEVDCLPSNPASTDIQQLPGEAKVVGTSVVWTIPQGAFPTGSVFTDLSAGTEISPTLDPVMDEASGGGATYKVGS
jgi:hypothetical protein